jgi:predicted MPP superfamily phosphohydrolase
VAGRGIVRRGAWAGLPRRTTPIAIAGAIAIGWGYFEAGWVRLRVLRVSVPGLPPALEGLRIAHLSDFHLGVPSRGRRAVERAVDWVEARRPDLVLVSGDLLSRPAGERRLRELLARLPRCYAVLGNHDVARSRDPFVRASALGDLGSAALLSDDARTLELRGRQIQIVGVDPRSYLARRARPARHVDRGADLRILLCHFPRVVNSLDAGDFQLVLAGDVHDGQICIPYPSGKIRLGSRRSPYISGLYSHPAAVLHVSPGLGTTFVPFRFFARPEATELVLRRG